MTKLFDYPEDWIAHSNKSLPSLAISIHKALITLGANVHLLNVSNPNVVGWDKSIQSTGFNVRFIETDYGCELHVCVWKEDKSTLAFLYVWKAFVDKGTVWGGPYKKDLSKTNPEQEKKEKPAVKPSEILPASVSEQEKKAADLWTCEYKSAKEIAMIFDASPNYDKWTVETVHTKIYKLRKTFPSAGIPKDEDRKKVMKLLTTSSK